MASDIIRLCAELSRQVCGMEDDEPAHLTLGVQALRDMNYEAVKERDALRAENRALRERLRAVVSTYACYNDAESYDDCRGYYPAESMACCICESRAALGEK